MNDEWLTYAEKHLKEIRMNSAKYEGVVLPSSPPPYSSYLPSLKKPLVKIINLFKDEISYRTSNYIPDRHTPGRLIPIYHAQIKNPLKIKKIKRKISKKYINTEKLEEIKFAFFPLHIEPEVTLLVYSPYYLNQIEVIRNIAYSLPTEMKLVVKEHPAAIGKRPYTFYKKILNIPNVLLANPNDDPRMYIENSKLITTIAGSVGLEGAFLGKPVITFGKTPYEIISNNMVIKIKDINTLSAQIRRILFDYKLDDELLIRYIASVMKNSTPINFYSKLLNRKNTYLIDSGESREDDLIRLSKYIIKIYKGY